MAESETQDITEVPPDAPPEQNGHAPDLLVESMLDGLVADRERIAAEKSHDMPLPGFHDRLWATYRLLGSKRSMAMVTAFADPSLKDAELTGRAALFLSDAVVGVYMKDGDRRIDFPGFSEEVPATWLDLPAKLVPPRPGSRAHDGASAVRTLVGRDNVLVGHALDVAGWMQGAQTDVSEQFAGESEGGPR